MNTPPPSHPPGGLDDPRRRRDFQPARFPRVNNQDAPPPDATERNDRVKIEFGAVYYDLNCEYARLAEVRKDAGSPARREAETKSLHAIERLLILRDGFEDQYAPSGVIAEPVVKDGFTVNLIISFGNEDAAGRLRSEVYTITACVPIPLPEGVRFEDLNLKIEGPGIPPE